MRCSVVQRPFTLHFRFSKNGMTKVPWDNEKSSLIKKISPTRRPVANNNNNAASRAAAKKSVGGGLSRMNRRGMPASHTHVFERGAGA